MKRINLLSLELAYAFLRSKHKEKTLSVMIYICFFGILIGSFSLMLTLIITTGFEKTISEKMQGINSSIILSADGNKIDVGQLRKYLQNKYPSVVKSVSGCSIRQAIIDKNKKQTLIFLKGIEPEFEGKVTNIEEKIIKPKKSIELKNILNGNSILIGQKVAEAFGLGVGDELTILIPEQSNKTKINLNKDKVKIGGIFKIGLEEYDSGFAFCSLELLKKMFEEKDGVDLVEISLVKQDKRFNLKNLLSLSFCKNLFNKIPENIVFAKLLQKELAEFKVQTWQDLYPALVSSLSLEKYVMFLIIALISLVASMNMISMLFVQIEQKKKNIAIFHAMGMSSRTVEAIFLWIGSLITLSAVTVGLAAAVAVGFYLESHPFIELPDVYYVSHLPAYVDLEMVAIVFICTMLLGLLATWIPARRTSRINIVNILRT